MRESLGLRRMASFAASNSGPNDVERFEMAYETVDDVDAWVGGLAKPNINGGLVGELFGHILHDQFTCLKKGDPLFSQVTWT